MTIDKLRNMDEDELSKTLILLSLRNGPLEESQICAVVKELNNHLTSCILLEMVLRGEVNATFDDGVVYTVKKEV